jgi:ubiquinone/menaquinone biosynthesis C-methylase UbiE
MTEQPLYHMNPLGRFSDRAEDYAMYRPSYPDEAIELILTGLTDPSCAVAADVGAGTGISSRLLAERGLQVWAIEPNEPMRQAADPHPRVSWIAASAEQTGLLNASVDRVTCFQAFHWFDPTKSLLEFRRILKPSGKLTVVWNTRDHDNDEFTQSYTEIVRHISNHHPAEGRKAAEQSLKASSEFHNFQQHVFTYLQAMDLPGLIGRARSSSYIPKDDQSQQQLVESLRKLYDRWADNSGVVYMSYRTQVFLAEPTPPNSSLL